MRPGLAPRLQWIFHVFAGLSWTAMLSSSLLFASATDLKTCVSPSHRQFDFWVGNWDVFELGEPTPVAHAQVESILNGCVLHENYQASDGSQGQSFSIYDTEKSAWRQTWVTGRGELLEIEGSFKNGEMVLSGTNQKGALVRGSWMPQKDEVREVAETSHDDGKTWKPWFNLLFRRAAEGDVTVGVSDTVAELDRQYQEAVKQNDATTMDRILADDFTLVTSSGKTYTKADLLREAKSGTTTYEHQEDTDRIVRIWGDTAIITANLWEKGTTEGKPFEFKLWFSDVYRLIDGRWKYVFAQSAYRPENQSPD